MKLSKLSAPVKRPELIHPYHSVDVVNGRAEDLVDIRIDLMHGANYNLGALVYLTASFGSRFIRGKITTLPQLSL